ncbi:hypothetical protein [Candidatus Nitrosocosmicus hydrocola]|nr:hypothetical protein [Candidatus Nitrosocosmicus hydrocola]
MGIAEAFKESDPVISGILSGIGNVRSKTILRINTNGLNFRRRRMKI